MSDLVINSIQFWNAIKIWLKNSHVVNRRLSGIVQIATWCLPSSENACDFITRCGNLTFDDFNLKTIHEIEESIFCILKSNFKLLEEEEFLRDTDNVNQKKHICVTLRKLLPRSSRYRDTFQLIVLDFPNNAVLSRSISKNCDKKILSPEFPHSLKLTSDKILLEIHSVLNGEESSRWLKEQLIPRLEKWAISENSNNNSLCNGSLNLVSLDEYNVLYQDLKLKYGKKIVEEWTESTDPSKFVFEDIAIATYLLLLWKYERKQINMDDKKQSFVDLGCGNGLLVYILNTEGHPGKGIDIRKRAIWDTYPNYVKLEVESITPSDRNLYPDTDWLIGNHSDELTPWIPIMAAKSSYNCRFFLLPCCAYEFNGKKYQRKDSSKSQYGEYIEYVQHICKNCKIETAIDRLKIPSTKRICLIGTKRLYPKEEYDTNIDQLQNFISEKNCSEGDGCPNNSELSENSQWNDDFKPRSPVERVRNCTKVEKCIVEEIISSVSSTLLRDKSNVVQNWNAGRCTSLSDLVKGISPDKLKFLKNECGGLQTLLRNHHHIFEVFSGRVKFRYPRTKSEMLAQIAIKNNRKKNKKDFPRKAKSCWFNANHPDGCPLSKDDCSFVHF